MYGVRRALLLLLLFLSAEAGAQERDGVALLPLRSRGLPPAEQKRVAQKVIAGLESARPDVVAPDELFARLSRDDRRRAALLDAKRLRAEGVERYLGLDRTAARERLDRALTLYRENFGEYVDPAGYAETHLWRGAERLASNDEAAARGDFAAAASLAPDLAPTMEQFPPTVIEAWQSAAAERARRPIPSDKPESLAAFANALGVGTIAIARVERGAEEGVVLEVLAWTSPNAPPRSARVVLEGDLDKASAAAASVARPTLTVASRTPEITPRDITRPPVRRPPPRGNKRNPWLWAGVGVLAAGAAASYLEYDRRQSAGGSEEFGVIIVPP